MVMDYFIVLFFINKPSDTIMNNIMFDYWKSKNYPFGFEPFTTEELKNIVFNKPCKKWNKLQKYIKQREKVS